MLVHILLIVILNLPLDFLKKSKFHFLNKQGMEIFLKNLKQELLIDSHLSVLVVLKYVLKRN